MDGIANLALEATTLSVVFVSLAVVAVTVIAAVFVLTVVACLAFGGWMLKAAEIAVLGPAGEGPSGG